MSGEQQAEEVASYMDQKKLFGEGMRDGMPVCLGYIAVGFSIGIAAKAVVFVLELVL